jgi:hypothetical protein
MTQITGIVQEVNNRGLAKGSNILVIGMKYGCYDPVKSGIDMLQAGQEVTFTAEQKGQYTNINGRATPTGNTGVVQAPAPTPVTPPAAFVPKNTGGQWQFPIPPLDYQRSVVRRDSVTAAAAIVDGYCSGCENDMDLGTRITYVLSTAKRFEEYSCGDDIEKEAQAAMSNLGTSQNTQ